LREVKRARQSGARFIGRERLLDSRFQKSEDLFFAVDHLYGRREEQFF
jgi:hypothetical protein